jgi:hypothetical protein
VNDCCADSGCANALADLESCTTEHGAACATLQSGKVAGSAGSALAACIAEKCLGECQPISGQSTTACSEPPFGQGSVCTCELASAPDDFVCSSAVYTGTKCCAPEGWPATGIQCGCLPLGCFPTSDGCLCSLVNYDPREMGGSGHCKTKHCCVQGSTCACRSGPCFDFETAVPECDVLAVTCDTGQKSVASCSMRTP